MSEAATSARSSSEDDGNCSGNPQGIYDKDERLIPADYILLYMYILGISSDFTKGYKKQHMCAEHSKATAIILLIHTCYMYMRMVPQVTCPVHPQADLEGRALKLFQLQFKLAKVLGACDYSAANLSAFHQHDPKAFNCIALVYGYILFHSFSKTCFIRGWVYFRNITGSPSSKNVVYSVCDILCMQRIVWENHRL